MSEVHDVVIVGAGMGGLATAAHLSGSGLRVTIVEREEAPGGRVGTLRRGNYTFDTGPTVLTMIDILERVFAAADAELTDHVDYTRLDPLYRACFADETEIHVRSERDAMLEEIRDKCGPKDADAFVRFCEWLEKLYSVEMHSFIDRNFDSPLDLLRPTSAAFDLVRLGAFRRLDTVVSNAFSDDRLRRLFSFQSMYAGLAPQQALAVYAVITYMDTVQGVYACQGGINSIATGLATAVQKAGVEILYNAPVEAILRSPAGRACGVRLAGGEELQARVVVCNPDLPYVYSALLQDVRPPKVVRNGKYSPSALVWHVGVKGKPQANIAHHNIHFGREWAPAFDSLFEKGERMEDPSLLVTVPTVSDPTLAPAGSSVLYVLEPVPNLDGKVDWTTERSHAREQLAQRINDLDYLAATETTIEEEELVDPLDWQRSGLERGTPFALSHRFFQSGPFRPTNAPREVPGLVFVGSGTVPGVGIPMVLISGRLAAERVHQALAST